MKELHSIAESNDVSRLYNLLDNEDIDSLCSPFLRKTMFYIARHDLDQQKIDTLIMDAAQAAARQLLAIFTKLEGLLI